MLFVFLSLETSLQCDEVNLVALVYNTYFTGMYGKANEMASVFFKEQFRLKIEFYFRGKNSNCALGAEKFPYQ